jgi:integrase
MAGRRRPRPVADEQLDGITLNELLLAFWRHAEQHYRHEDGTPTNELNNLRASLRPLKDLYGGLAVSEFSPLKLKALRQKMIDSQRYRVRFECGTEAWAWEAGFRRTTAGCEAMYRGQWHPAELLATKKAMSRGVINQRIGHILRVFRWGVGEELVPETVHRALAAVPGLQQGRTEAQESTGVKPVAAEVVETALPSMPAPVAAMVRLQLLTGMRVGEVMILRATDLT